MLIISKFHDYYDSALGLGVDKTIVYSRELITIDIVDPRNPIFEAFKYYPSYHSTWWYPERTLPCFNFVPSIIGFCGKLYPCYQFNQNVYVHKIEEITDLVEKRRPDLMKEYLEKRKWYHAANFSQHNCEQFLIADYQPLYGELFQKYKTPLFLVQGGYYRDSTTRLFLNPCLKDLDFQRIVDPYTACQEIMMYISGVLGVNTPETVAVSDRTMAVKKGFDNQSFKTLSPGKKLKRRLTKAG